MPNKRRPALTRAERRLIEAGRWQAIEIWVKGNKPYGLASIDHGAELAAAWASRFKAWGIKSGDWQAMAERLVFEPAPEFANLPREVSLPIEITATLVWVTLDMLIERGAPLSQAVHRLMKGSHPEVHAAIRKAYERRIAWKAKFGSAQASEIWKPVKPPR